MKIKLYIEGGGDSHLQDTQFRAGWRAFFEGPGQQDIVAECAVFPGQAGDVRDGSGIVRHRNQAMASAGHGETRAAIARDLARAAVSRS